MSQGSVGSSLGTPLMIYLWRPYRRCLASPRAIGGDHRSVWIQKPISTISHKNHGHLKNQVVYHKTINTSKKVGFGGAHGIYIIIYIHIFPLSQNNRDANPLPWCQGEVKHNFHVKLWVKQRPKTSTVNLWIYDETLGTKCWIPMVSGLYWIF